MAEQELLAGKTGFPDWLSEAASRDDPAEIQKRRRRAQLQCFAPPTYFNHYLCLDSDTLPDLTDFRHPVGLGTRDEFTDMRRGEPPLDPHMKIWIATNVKTCKATADHGPNGTPERSKFTKPLADSPPRIGNITMESYLPVKQQNFTTYIPRHPQAWAESSWFADYGDTLDAWSVQAVGFGWKIISAGGQGGAGKGQSGNASYVESGKDQSAVMLTVGCGGVVLPGKSASSSGKFLAGAWVQGIG